MNLLWFGLKSVLTLVLLAIAAGMLLLFVRGSADYGQIGVTSVALFMAALLWVRVEPGRLELALVGVVLSLGLIFLSAEAVIGGGAYPRACAIKQAWCALDNLLYALGGPLLAAAPFFLAGLALLFFSVSAVLRHTFRVVRWRDRRGV